MKDSVLPLIAILRGITPNEVVDYATLLYQHGYRYIEIPLNSLNAYESIERAVQALGDEACVGAGTVTNMSELEKVLAVGAELIVSPNCNVNVIKTALQQGCEVFPGVMTPTEAYDAINCGVTQLKFFPAEILGINGVKAITTILPKEVKCFPVGGIQADAGLMTQYLKAGATGFGLGSALYYPGMSLEHFSGNALAFKQAFTAASDLRGAS